MGYWFLKLKALREVVINMILHRDYRSSSDSIVKVFNDRIEFYNPERLPDTISVDDLLSNNYRSTPRNKLLADFSKDMGLIEKYGSGIKRILNYFRDANLPVPQFKNISNGFMVTVFSENVTENVTENITNDRHPLIVASIAKNALIMVDELAERTGVTRRTILWDLDWLRNQNLIKRVGPDKGGSWIVV